MMQIGMRLGFPWINQNTKCPSKFFNFADGTNVLSPSINFTRTTNATVTNSAGLITYAPHNLLTYSEQFDNAIWVKTQSSVTANAITAPNGTVTADLLIPNTTSNVHYISETISSTGVATYSVYAKAGGYNFIGLAINNSGTTALWFNLTTGVASTIGASVTSYSSTFIADGWWRFTITANVALGNVQIYAGTTAAFSSFVGDGTSGIYLWGAQLEVGASPTTYNPTTVKNLLGFSELFDNAAWTKSNSFVQTNLLNYTEAFDNVYWSKVGTAIVTADTTIAPNGYQTADTLTGATDIAWSTGNGVNRQVSGLTSSTAYTFSLYIKGIVGTTAKISIRDQSTGLTTDSAALTLTSEWQRVSISRTTGAATTALGLIIGATNGTVAIWGAQLVQGSVAGDYRRTDAAALPVYYPNHNGVVCAEKLVVDGTVGGKYIVQNTSQILNTPITLSCYAKKAEFEYVFLYNAQTNNGRVFNLNDGTSNAIAGITNPESYSIAPVGNGYYRCSITFLAATGGNGTRIYALSSSSTTSVIGDGTSGIYIFGAQLTDSASLDPYVLNAAAAPTAAAYYGARFDYDPVTLAPKGLLIEEQRSNMLLNSAIAGTNIATQNVTVTAVAHTLTFYGTGNIVLSGTASATLTGTGAYPTRSTLTFTPTAGTLTLTVTGTVQYAQLEIGSFATSFIPTAASQVTRAADVATIQGSNFYSWYNQNEGSVSTTVGTFPAQTARIFTVSDSSINNQIFFSSSLGSLAVFNVYTAGAFVVQINTANNNSGKTAGAYKINDFAAVINNGSVATDTSGGLGIYNSLVIGSTFNGSAGHLNGTIKQISYYPQRLSNETLKGLTA